MKKVLTTLSVFALLPSFIALAAYNSVTLSSGSSLVVSVGGSNLTLTVSDGAVQTLQVLTSSITATLVSGSHLDITSADRKSFTYTVGSAVSSFTCGSSSSQLSISSTVSQDIIVTPLSGTCTSPDAGGGAGGGSGDSGGGGSSPSPAPAPSPEPSPAPAPTPAVVPAPAVAPSPVPATTVANPSVVAQLVSPVFNKLIQVGAKGDDVKRLQELLRQDKDIYPNGLATGYFGNLTREAVRKFQLKYGVIKKATDLGNGTLGPKTRAKLKEVFGSGVVAPATSGAQSTLDALTKQLQELQAKAVKPAPAPAPAPSSQQLQLDAALKALKELQAKAATQ